MQKQVVDSIYEILDTIKEAMEYLKYKENQELREVIMMGRQEITQELEKELGFSLEQRMDIWSLSTEDWLITIYRVIEEMINPFSPQNAFDMKFLKIINCIWNYSKDALLQIMIGKVNQLKKESTEDYEYICNYFSRFPFWGTFNPEQGDYTTLKLRVNVLKQHSYDLLWLYRRLNDYMSKCSLCAILKNWLFLDGKDLMQIKSSFSDYWEPDIFPNNHNDVLVDAGAFIGDSIIEYVKAYGTNYKKIYAYEICEDSYEFLCNNTKVLHDIIRKFKGIGKEQGKLFLEQNNNSSANRLSQDGNIQQEVEVVSLDEDIEDVVTFIKMDIEGAEQDALLGCQNIIRTQHPKLAICIYHGYEDIWKIPYLIDSIYSDYEFYLRYYGGDLIPTEFVLLCKP